MTLYHFVTILSREQTYMVMKGEPKDGIDECYILTPNFEQDTASLDLTGSTVRLNL